MGTIKILFSQIKELEKVTTLRRAPCAWTESITLYRRVCFVPVDEAFFFLYSLPKAATTTKGKNLSYTLEMKR